MKTSKFDLIKNSSFIYSTSFSDEESDDDEAMDPTRPPRPPVRGKKLGIYCIDETDRDF